MHRLLRRQLAKHPLPQPTRDAVERLLNAVDGAYAEADADRAQLERSLDLTSSELLDRNERLRLDIEARARAEAALRQADARMRAILGALPDLLFVASDSYELLEWHARDADAYGLPSAVRPGQSLRETFPVAVSRLIEGAIDEAITSATTAACEYEIDVDGERRKFGARIAPCDGPGAVVMVRDYTAQLRLQERLRITDRMASLGTLAAGVAHEINNPLSYVITSLDLLAEAPSNATVGAEFRAAIEDARSGAQRVRMIVRDLRVFCHPSPVADGRADVRRALESALRLAANEIRHRARVVTDLSVASMAIGDESRLGQVFLNLLSNAAQAIEPGDAANNEIRIAAWSEASTIVVEISDTGCGLPFGGSARIFDPFVTTKPVGLGTGLGLSICAGIVSAMGGEVVALPRDPRGALFRVTLPAETKPRRETQAPAGDRVRVPQHGTRRRILIIDDDPQVALALVRGLAGHAAEAITDPKEALARLGAGDRFDVILCDIMMPELTGVDVYEAAVRLRPELAGAFIFMSGGVFSSRETRFLDRVSNPRFDKPFDISDLRSLIAGHVG